MFPDLHLKAARALLDQKENSPNEIQPSAKCSSQIVFLFSPTAAAAPLDPSERLKCSTVSFFPVYRLKASIFNLKKFHSQPSSDFIWSYLFMMNVSQTMETEEDFLTCLQIKLYHPQQSSNGFYGCLPLRTRRRHCADDPVRLGRDAQACTYILLDPRVSRKQLALQAYRTPQSSELLFTIQNLSQRGKVSVNSSALGYLEKMDLPDKALIRFGGYELLIIRESGEAKASFEVEFEVLAVPPSRETCTYVPSTPPVMETRSDIMIDFSAQDSSFGPQESDETLPHCHS